MGSIGAVVVASVAFVGSHFLLSHPLRGALVRAVGEKGFLGIYSLVAFLTLGWMVMTYKRAPVSSPLWVPGDGIWAVVTVVMLIASILLSIIVLSVPAAGDMDPARADAFAMMMGGTPRIWLGGIIAYGISQTLNVTLFAALKGREGSRMLWLRAAVASILSQIVDTLLFVSIAFYGIFPIGELLLGQMLAKVVLSALLVPPVIYLLVGLGRRLDRA